MTFLTGLPFFTPTVSRVIDAKKVEFPLKREMKLVMAVYCGHRHGGEEKTVTIRGIDKNYYEQFVRLTKIWGRNTGFAFSRVICHYGKDHPFRLIPPFMKKGFRGPLPSLEVIEGPDELKVTKKDLTEAGNVRYCFKSIEKLIFNDKIDNQTLLNHVFQIRNCNVQMPKTISNLLFHSLVRNRPVYTPIEDNLKDITIRNVEKDIYEEFAATCQLKKKKIGDAVNELLSQLVPEMEYRHILLFDLDVDPHTVLTVTSLDRLDVSVQDLAEIRDRKILFHRIKELKFSSNIEKTDFVNSVIGIYNCENVKLPPTIPHLIQLSRVKIYPK